MNRILSWFCKIFLAPIVKILFIKEVRGWENIPKRNFILASNHQSHLDQLATGYICVPKEYHFIGQTDRYTGITKVLLYILYFIAGVIHLNRKSEESKKQALTKAVDFLKKGHSLIIYPEGTRTRTGQMGKGKWGIAKIFSKTGAPVLPIAIKGTFELLPPGGKLKIKRIIRINIGRSLYFTKELERLKKISPSSKENKEILLEITNKIMEQITILKDQLN